GVDAEGAHGYPAVGPRPARDHRPGGSSGWQGTDEHRRNATAARQCRTEGQRKYSSLGVAARLEVMDMIQKSLDHKLARIHADPPGCKDFILADAKDADMALAIGAPGRSPEAHSGEVGYRSLSEFRNTIEQIVEQAMVDIMLMSASTSEVLTIHKRIF